MLELIFECQTCTHRCKLQVLHLLYVRWEYVVLQDVGGFLRGVRQVRSGAQYHRINIKLDKKHTIANCVNRSIS